MEALNPARLPLDRHPEALTLQDLEPVRPLRICLLGYRSHPYGGGQGVYLRYLSKALLELGHRVDVISGPPYPHLDPGVRLIEMPSMNLYETGLLSLRPRHLRSLSNIIEWLSKLTGGFAEPQAFGRRALRYLREHRGDYDIVHDNQSLSYGMLALQREGVPLVTTIHHPITSDLRLALAACRWWWPRLLTRRWHSFLGMQKRVARGLRHVVTVSECSRGDIARDFGLPAERLTLVHNGVDTEVFAPDAGVARKPLQLMATASADQPLKGLAVLLNAFAALLPAHPGLRLLVVGRPRPGGRYRKADRAARSRRTHRLRERHQHRRAGAPVPRGHAGRGALAVRGLRPAGLGGDGLRGPGGLLGRRRAARGGGRCRRAGAGR